MAFTRPPRPQLTDVVVVLDEGDHPSQQMPLNPLLQVGRLHADGAD